MQRWSVDTLSDFYVSLKLRLASPLNNDHVSMPPPLLRALGPPPQIHIDFHPLSIPLSIHCNNSICTPFLRSLSLRFRICLKLLFDCHVFLISLLGTQTNGGRERERLRREKAENSFWWRILRLLLGRNFDEWNLNCQFRLLFQEHNFYDPR